MMDNYNEALEALLRAAIAFEEATAEVHSKPCRKDLYEVVMKWNEATTGLHEAAREYTRQYRKINR